MCLRLHLCALLLLSGKEITDDKEMSENSFGLLVSYSLPPPLSVYYRILRSTTNTTITTTTTTSTIASRAFSATYNLQLTLTLASSSASALALSLPRLVARRERGGALLAWLVHLSNLSHLLQIDDAASRQAGSRQGQ